MTRQNSLPKSEVFQKKHHWFLVRGLGRESGHWGDFAERLKKVFPQAEVSFLDLIGAGVHRHETVPFSLSRFSEVSREDFLKARREKPDSGPAFILGMSLGGMLIMDWLGRFPGDFEGVVLVNSSAKKFSTPWQRMHPRALWGIVHAAMAPTAEIRETRVLQVVAESEERRKATLAIWAKVFEERPITTVNAIRQILAASQFHPEIPKNPPKTLVLNALGDRMVHPSCSEKLAKAWNAELRSHPWGGHDLGVDDPDWLIEQLRTWEHS